MIKDAIIKKHSTFTEAINVGFDFFYVVMMTICSVLMYMDEIQPYKVREEMFLVRATRHDNRCIFQYHMLDPHS